jgi:peptidoglycan-N-acetylglucosamine deacetylase
MPTSDPKPVTLSFDNGPHPEVTPSVLDVLSRRDVSATFFVTGERLSRYRGAAERAAAEGHWIGNHTWSHSHPFRERGDAAFVQEEIECTQSEIGVLAHPDRFFRPYGGGGRLEGVLNGTAADHLRRGRYTCVLWNVVPGDWKDPDGWPQVALGQVDAIDWPLIVLHDIHAQAMRHLDAFIGKVLDRGCSFRQDFPDGCVAIRRGQATAALSTGVLVD